MSNTTIQQVKPAPGYLLIEPQKSSKQTASGIYLPETHDEKPQQGTVVAVGDDEVTTTGPKKSPAPAKSQVIYKKWGGNEVKIDDKEYLFVKFDDILAIIS